MKVMDISFETNVLCLTFSASLLMYRVFCQCILHRNLFKERDTFNKFILIGVLLVLTEVWCTTII